ncbi:magnesium transporter [Falsiroseomonas sp.]|uniref:magnesium transporter n=1 Tax=Falsiroseomonas sp. TaxID=2870721 RepID=UPI002733275C|nr:magnesium transporter [Falsiroseomonas sp.]MDP3417759.1 magnesium transporter [Falsiroseomonas sp.]
MNTTTLPPEAAATLHPVDLAALLDLRPAEMALAVLSGLPLARRAETFGYLAPETQITIAALAPPRALAELVTAMDADERADLWARLPDAARESLGRALAATEREDIRTLSAYPSGTAGAVMTSEYAVLRPAMTARTAIEALRGQAASKETIQVAYVLSPQRRLIGTVSLEELVLALADRPVAEIMRTDPPFVRADEPAEQAARAVARYDLPAVPVINREDAMVGIVTADDAMDVAQAEATEDFEKAGGTGAGLVADLRRAGIAVMYRKRAGWLVALVFANILSGFGIAAFEDTIAANLVLVFFLPLLIASAGNAGSQAATLTVRALATGQVGLSDWSRMLGREVLVALALGLTMAAAVAGIGLWRGGPEVALVVALTMVLVVVAGSLVGMSLPFLLDRMKMDPASASAPLVTSIADVTGVLVYFGIAAAILPS